ncbi:MAG: GvpL/GvpF family gas vesicle protein [Gemmatimonadetes bacterium]|nr:GvpL/GvpF family gas vesicle protein [Gemmatimonadota bacterium]
MSGAYLYCLAPAGSVPPAGLVGIEDAPVEAVAVATFTAWYSRLDARPEPSIERIRRHNQVVEVALTEDATPVPARFGQWFATLAALAEKLRAGAAAHEESLRRVAGAVEFGLRVVDVEAPTSPVPTPAPQATTGRAYLEALAARAAADRSRDQRGQEIAAGIAAILGSAVRQQRIDRARSRHEVVGIAHLVARRDVESYRAGVAAARRRYPELRFLLSGPWPPYSFAA